MDKGLKNLQNGILMKNNIAVVGLGYVGLPLALSLSRFFNVFGFDKSIRKELDELKKKYDSNKSYNFRI